MGNRYQEAIENSNIVSKTDVNGIITFVNDEFCNIFGYTKEELIGKNHNIVRHPDVPPSSFEILWFVIKSQKKPYKATVKNLTKCGKTVYLNTTVTPILDENDNIEEFIAIRYDVTKEVELKQYIQKQDEELKALNETLELRVREQTKQLTELNLNLEKRVQEEIKKNEEKQKILFWQSRMASLGQMIANIAHQWRQPLTELGLTLFNIHKASQKSDHEKVLEYYEEGKFVISSMSKTIEDFSNFFAPNKSKEPFYIGSSINEALELLKKLILRENITIRTSIDKIKVNGISNELSQVIINLIHNSNDAFNQHNITNKKIIIKAHKIDDKFATIEIMDNALGVHPEEKLEKIFEPYFTTKHSSQGTGLGLFMSRLIIEKSLNGSISAKNHHDGVTFTIKIPIL